ncbi:2Fe-2S iron-sulfur cluster-binding protein, partial [Chloroflexota bacterium]
MAKGSPNRFNVHFAQDNVDILAEPGTNLMETSIAAGVHINASCGGAGVCGTCKVFIKKGETESTRTNCISDKEYEKGIRQACQCR